MCYLPVSEGTTCSVIDNGFSFLKFCRFKNVIFEVSPTEEVGDFEVKAKFMGVQMETFMLHYQVRTTLFNSSV